MPGKSVKFRDKMGIDQAHMDMNIVDYRSSMYNQHPSKASVYIQKTCSLRNIMTRNIMEFSFIDSYFPRLSI